MFPGQADALTAAAAIARWVGVTRYRDFVIVGPDAESAHLVEGVSARTGLAAMVGAKRRSGDREVSIRFIRKPKARGAIIVDDIASSGATLAVCVRALRRVKIPVVDVVVVHALLNQERSRGYAERDAAESCRATRFLISPTGSRLPSCLRGRSLEKLMQRGRPGQASR